MEMIENIDTELFLTDIKDTQTGETYRLSEEIMTIIKLWWEKKSKELLSSLQQAQEEIGK